MITTKNSNNILIMEDKIQKIIESAKEYCVKNGIQWSAWQEQLILQTIEETFLICKK